MDSDLDGIERPGTPGLSRAQSPRVDNAVLQFEAPAVSVPATADHTRGSSGYAVGTLPPRPFTAKIPIASGRDGDVVYKTLDLFAQTKLVDAWWNHRASSPRKNTMRPVRPRMPGELRRPFPTTPVVIAQPSCMALDFHPAELKVARPRQASHTRQYTTGSGGRAVDSGHGKGDDATNKRIRAQRVPGVHYGRSSYHANRIFDRARPSPCKRAELLLDPYDVAAVDSRAMGSVGLGASNHGWQSADMQVFRIGDAGRRQFGCSGSPRGASSFTGATNSGRASFARVFNKDYKRWGVHSGASSISTNQRRVLSASPSPHQQQRDHRPTPPPPPSTTT